MRKRRDTSSLLGLLRFGFTFVRAGRLIRFGWHMLVGLGFTAPLLWGLFLEVGSGLSAYRKVVTPKVYLVCD